MSESRDWIRAQLGGDRAGSGAPSAEERQYAEGAPGADDEVDEQDEEAAAEEVEMPDTWPADFWNRLLPEVQQEYERGEIDLAAEWALWSSGGVDTGDDEELPDEPLAELPPTADQLAEWSQRWAEIAQEGGNEEATAAEALAHADSFAYAARATALAEVQAGRRSSHDLTGDDQRDYVQAAINEKIAAGKARWGER